MIKNLNSEKRKSTKQKSKGNRKKKIEFLKQQ